MHDARGVDRAQAFREPSGQPQHRPGGQRPAFGYRVIQRRPGHVGRAQPGHRAVGIRVDDRSGERPAHHARDGDLLPETRPEAGIARQVVAHNLDRDKLAFCCYAEEHPAHAARA